MIIHTWDSKGRLPLFQGSCHLHHEFLADLEDHSRDTLIVGAEDSFEVERILEASALAVAVVSAFTILERRRGTICDNG
jgi:hypothetical protein